MLFRSAIKLFLDVEGTLKANNEQLIETLLDGGQEDSGSAAQPAAAAGKAAESREPAMPATSATRPDFWRSLAGHDSAGLPGRAGMHASKSLIGDARRGTGSPMPVVEVITSLAFPIQASIMNIADPDCRIPPRASRRPAPFRTGRRRRPRAGGGRVAARLMMGWKPPS